MMDKIPDRTNVILQLFGGLQTLADLLLIVHHLNRTVNQLGNRIMPYTHRFTANAWRAQCQHTWDRTTSNRSSSTSISAIAATVGAAQMHDRTYKNECAEKVKASQAKLAVDLK